MAAATSGWIENESERILAGYRGTDRRHCGLVFVERQFYFLDRKAKLNFKFSHLGRPGLLELFQRLEKESDRVEHLDLSSEKFEDHDMEIKLANFVRKSRTLKTLRIGYLSAVGRIHLARALADNACIRVVSFGTSDEDIWNNIDVIDIALTAAAKMRPAGFSRITFFGDGCAPYADTKKLGEFPGVKYLDNGNVDLYWAAPLKTTREQHLLDTVFHPLFKRQ